MKTLREWAALYADQVGVVLLDPDGFDRTDPLMLERQYTEKGFRAGLSHSTCEWPSKVLTEGLPWITEESKE